MKEVFCFVMKRQYILWPLLALVYFFVSKSAISLDDYVYTAGDDPGYQILARNYATGHGSMILNIFGNLNEYRFVDSDENYWKQWRNEKPIYYFYRTPGYPILFLGNLYKLFGNTSPYLGKLAALLVLCMVAGAMPWLGSQFWGERGGWIGLVASPFQIAYTAHWCDRIVTEPLIIGSVFLIACVFVFYQKKQNIWTGILLGLVLVYGLSVKGSLIFIPVLMLSYLLWWSIKKKKKIYPLILAGLLFLFCIFSWSNYASMKLQKRIIISEQADEVLMDGNNEYSSGWWAREWRDHPESFYRTDKMENKSSLVRVLNFYKHHPAKLPELVIKKMMTAFVPQLFLLLLILLMGIRSITYKINKAKIKYLLAIVGLVIILALSVVHTYVMLNQQLLINAHAVIMSNILYILLLGIITTGLLHLVFQYRKVLFADVPVLFYIVSLNFIALTIILFGDARFVMVMHFLFILVFFEQTFSYFDQLKLNKEAKD